jgi:23S rRNA-/tRNA-specific pseudouridylate synthase
MEDYQLCNEYLEQFRATLDNETSRESEKEYVAILKKVFNEAPQIITANVGDSLKYKDIIFRSSELTF